MKLGITDHLDCAHFLPGHPRCGQLHGHTYTLELTVEGETSGGMLVDFAELKRLTREVVARFDHRNWNDVLEYPSVENICALLHTQLKQRIALPFSLRVFEGHGKWAEL